VEVPSSTSSLACGITQNNENMLPSDVKIHCRGSSGSSRGRELAAEAMVYPKHAAKVPRRACELPSAQTRKCIDWL